MPVWRPEECICPTCGKSHVRNAGHKSIYAPKQPEPIVKCSECVYRELDEEIAREREAAQQATEVVFWDSIELRQHRLLQAELQVIREKLYGRTKLPEYWRSVRKKLENM